MQNPSTREEIANPIAGGWSLPEQLEPERRVARAAHPGAPARGTALATPGPLLPAPIALVGIAPVLSPLAHLQGLSARRASGPSPLALARLRDGSGGEDARGKLAPYLGPLLRMIEDQPRAKIKDFYLTLRERGYSGSYDLVKKKIHAFRRELGRQAGSHFASAESPRAQVEIARIPMKGPGGDRKLHLFTMVLGHSGRYYAELAEGCDMASFLRFHQNAFGFFGGVPAGVFYDPLESPALRRLVGNFPFHMPIADCGHHFGYAAQPTPAFAPWMKGRLKRPAKILKKSFFPGYAFTSLEQANAAMREWVARQEGQGPPRGRADKTQREKLGPLPVAEFNFHGRRQFLRLRG